MYIKINIKITSEEKENALKILQTINTIKICLSKQNITIKEWIYKILFKVKLVKIYSKEAEFLQTNKT